MYGRKFQTLLKLIVLVKNRKKDDRTRQVLRSLFAKRT